MVRKSNPAKALESMAKRPEIFNSSMEMVAPHAKKQRKPTGLSSRNNARTITRRSERLRSGSTPAQIQGMETEIEEINLCESDKEDEPHIEENTQESMSAEKSLEQKFDYPVYPVDGSKDGKRHFRSESPSADRKYKRLYIGSQKKIEALTNENHELSMKLEVALGKIEAYGDASRVCSDLLGKLKDVILISNLSKATETAMNLSSQAILGRCSSPDNIGDPKASASAKRKKLAKSK